MRLIILTTLFLIPLIGLASFPIMEDTLKTTVDTLTEKKNIEQYHLQLQKQGFDISNCMCVDCRKFKGITENLNKNSSSKESTLSPLQSAKINMLFLRSAMLIGLVTIGIYIDWDFHPIIFLIILTIFLVFYLRIILKKMKKESKLKK
jgi:predicted PurR-regulated permease PerM